jgi:hypothetical protein
VAGGFVENANSTSVSSTKGRLFIYCKNTNPVADMDLSLATAVMI